jgi:carbamoyltransferase
MDHAYWGPAFDAEEIAKILDALRFEIATAKCTVEDIGDEAALCRRTAVAIAHGQVANPFAPTRAWLARNSRGFNPIMAGSVPVRSFAR